MSNKDQTVPGITGPLPKPRTAKNQYELEKKRRLAKHLGKNVGGVQYSADVNPYYNPRQRTFREFVELAEGKKKDKNIPPNAVPGTYEERPDGSKTYTLKPGKPFKKPPSKKEIFKLLAQQGGIGGKAIQKAQKQQEGFSYGSKEYQQQLEKQRKAKKAQQQQKRQRRSDELHRERIEGRGIRAVHKGQSGWMKDGEFTPDT